MTQTKKKKGVSLPFNADLVHLYAIRSRALDVECYRGFASMADLARVSRPDEYDENKHVDGIQRELSSKHAREAYEYAANQIPGQKRIWPEVMLSLRLPDDGVKIKENPKWKGGLDYCAVTIKIDMTKIRLDTINPTFSRVDGNHRLHYAAGIDKKRPALDGVISPFCIMKDITRDQEVLIFKTINEKQVKLKTDHLLRIEGQIAKETELLENHPVLWLTQKIRDDQFSPFYDLVHVAGARPKDAPYIIRQKSLYDGIAVLFKRLDINLKQSENLQALPTLIVRYFSAVEKRWPNEWKDRKSYLLMTNTGMQAIGIVGAQLINRHVLAEKLDVDDFLRDLKATQFSWQKVQGEKRLPMGRPGSETIAQEILSSIHGTEVDLKRLIKK